MRTAVLLSALASASLLHATESPLPSVTIMMVTNSRPEFVEHALGTIRLQDYPMHLVNVVIVDDSPVALQVPGLVPGDSVHSGLNVTYVTCTPKSVGSKRDMAARRAQGDVLVHWDDDDFYGASRLRLQLAPIVNGSADVTVLPHSLTYFMTTDELHVARHTMNADCLGGCGTTSRASHGPHFGTLAYRTALYGAASPGIAAHSGTLRKGAHLGGYEHGIPTFPDTSEGEDYVFAQRAVQAGATLELVTPPAAGGTPPVFVCVRHTSNTWQWQEVVPRFHATSTSMLSGRDRAFAHTMRQQGVLNALAARRSGAPVSNRWPARDMQPGYFDTLYAGATRVSAAELARVQRTEATPSRFAANTSVVKYFELGDQWAWDKFQPFLEKCMWGPGSTHTRKQCLAKWNFSSYDRVTEFVLPALPRMGSVGSAPTSVADHGGRFHFTAPGANGSITLQRNLTIVYHTTLSITGSIDAAGHHIVLGAFSALHVSGDILNYASIVLGAFCILNVSGNVASGPRGGESSRPGSPGGTLHVSGGGSCSADFFCEPSSTPTCTSAPSIRYSRCGSCSPLAIGGGLLSANLQTGSCVQLHVTGETVLTKELTVGHDSIIQMGMDARASAMSFAGSRTYFHVQGSFALGDSVYVTCPNGDWNVLQLGSFSVQGSVTLGRSQLHVDGNVNISGKLVTSDVPAHDRLSSVDVAVGGGLSVGTLSLNTAWIVSVIGAIRAESINLATDAALAAGSISANTRVGMGARLAVAEINASALEVAPGGLVDQAIGGARCGRLQLASAARVSSLLSGVRVVGALQLSPHFLTQCEGDLGFVAAGTATLGVRPTPEQNASATCKWPAFFGPNPWGSHLPSSACRIMRNTCGANHTSDLTAAWLASLVAKHSCILGPNGIAIGSSYYNWTQPCKS